jgi:5,10-methylenetetrahydromethanopterin reductase
MKLNFGLCLFCTESPASFVEQVRAAEDVGFRYLWLADTSPRGHDVFCYLTLTAMNSSRIGLGSSVLHPYVRHLAVLMTGMATIDELSEGRAYIGLGTGGGSIKSLGYKQATVAAMREAILLSRQLMRGETVESDVEPVQMKAVELRFPPRRALPIYLAATGPRMLGLGGELADGVFLHAGVSPPVVRHALESCSVGTEKRDPALPPFDVSPFVYTSVAVDRARAFADCRRGAGNVVRRLPRYAEIAGCRASEIEAAGRGDPLPDDVVDRFSLSGTAADCIRKVEALAELGIRHITMVPAGEDNLALIRTLGEHIVARFG